MVIGQEITNEEMCMEKEPMKRRERYESQAERQNV